LQIQWKHRWEGKTVNEWMDLRKVLTEVVDIHVPLKKEGKIIRNRLSRQTRRKIGERCRAWRQYCKYRPRKNFERYKQM